MEISKYKRKVVKFNMFRSRRKELQENLTKTNIDILVSLIPMLLVAFFVYEITPVLVILSAVIA